MRFSPVKKTEPIIEITDNGAQISVKTVLPKPQKNDTPWPEDDYPDTEINTDVPDN